MALILPFITKEVKNIFKEVNNISLKLKSCYMLRAQDV